MAKQPSGNGGAPGAAAPDPKPPSFAKDIAPLFTAEDYGCMITHSTYNDWDPVLDLRDHDSVKAWASEIYNAVRGDPPLMPKDPLEAPWTDTMIDTFHRWMLAGFPP